MVGHVNGHFNQKVVVLFHDSFHGAHLLYFLGWATNLRADGLHVRKQYLLKNWTPGLKCLTNGFEYMSCESWPGMFTSSSFAMINNLHGKKLAR